MTSNIGSPIIQEFYGSGKLSAKDLTEMENLVRVELKTHFRPEFLNRVDDIIVFHNLTEEQLAAIVEVQLQRLDKRLLLQNLHLEVDKSARKLLAREGYDPQFGARPLKRTIQELLLDPLALKLLDGSLKPGDTVKVRAQDGALDFQKQ
jgi:ATP-dependent Clp protease ATP-binding subunit ClpA